MLSRPRRGPDPDRRRRCALDAPKTKELKDQFGKLGLGSALIIAGPRSSQISASPPATCPNIDVLPVQGINVYDILRRDKLVLTQRGCGRAGGALQMNQIRATTT
jgi:ribosomal protein L4